MKVLIIGLGSIAQKHISALLTLDPHIQIYALRSSSNSSFVTNVINLYSLEEIKDIKFDFIIISSPTSQHKKNIEWFKDWGIPIFIEKPLFHLLTIKDTVETIEKANIKTYVACNLRFLECINFVKKYIEESKPRINEVNVYCGSYLPEWRLGINYKENYSAIPEMGGGVHIDLIHEIDYLYWLFGIPEKTTKIFSNISSLNIRSFDYANYCLKYDFFHASIILNYYRREPKRTLEIVSENQIIKVDLLTNTVIINKNMVFQSKKRITDTYREQMNYFVDCVREKKETFNTIRDAYNVLQICLI